MSLRWRPIALQRSCGSWSCHTDSGLLSGLSVRGRVQGLLQIGLQILKGLDSDRQPDRAGSDARNLHLSRIKISSTHELGWQHQRFGGSKAGRPRKQFERVGYTLSRWRAPGKFEAHYAAKITHLRAGQGVAGVRR